MRVATLAFLIVFSGPLSVWAGSSVMNSIEVRTSSGGLTAEGGTIVEGSSSKNVLIKTTVDGNAIEDVDIRMMGTGAPIRIETVVTEDVDGGVVAATRVSTGTVSADTIRRGAWQSFKRLWMYVLSIFTNT